MSDTTKGLRLYNTLTRTKEDFVPIDPENVRMYVCGPTVYDFAHIGNARPVIVFDVLFRLLKHLAKQGVWDGGKGETEVTYVRNITDVDDKINARAARDHPGLPLNEAIRKVTEETNAQFQADVKALGCLEPTFQPRATEYIDEMKAMIERLVALGVAYVAEGHVLFSPSAMNARPKGPRYGALARRSLDEMLAGARVDVASYKRDEMDFVLWKPSKPGEPGWPSPSGIEGLGRPGWHIECSAMSMAKLLEPFGGGLTCDDPEKNIFDIHAGGIDLVFPHHENEIAQSCCAFGTERMANIWMHNGFLQVEGKKMAKSEGNFVTINELLNTEKFGGRKWPGEVLRLAMLMTHYRQPIDFTLATLESAQTELVNWATVVETYASTVPFTVGSGMLSVLSDDLNTSAALTELRRLWKELRSPSASESETQIALSQFFGGLSLMGLDPVAVAKVVEKDSPLSPAVSDQLQKLLKQRIEARSQKNWSEADRIRGEIAKLGFSVSDIKDEAGNVVPRLEPLR